MTKTGLGSRLVEYGDRELALFLRRSVAQSMGFSREALDRPIVGIVNTFSELNHCHRGLRELCEAVKRGVWQGGGLPLEFPVISLGEMFTSPTAMFARNLMAMDVEVMLRAQPLDAAVLVGGCDKTVPALLMGAASANLPAIVVVAGPMLAGSVEGQRVGACTDCRRIWGRFRARGDRSGRGGQGWRAARPDCRDVRGHGHREHDGVPHRGARHDAARRRVGSGSVRGPAPPRRGVGPAGRGTRCGAPHPRSDPDSVPRSRTPFACCRRSAARPTASSI